MKYNSFGEPIGGTATVAGFLFGFDGMPWDPSASQYEAGAVPDPLNRPAPPPNPIGFASGTTNLTAWCGNDPTGLTDPTGEDAWQGTAGSGSNLSQEAFLADTDPWAKYAPLTPGAAAAEGATGEAAAGQPAVAEPAAVPGGEPLYSSGVADSILTRRPARPGQTPR